MPQQAVGTAGAKLQLRRGLGLSVSLSLWESLGLAPVTLSLLAVLAGALAALLGAFVGALAGLSFWTPSSVGLSSAMKCLHPPCARRPGSGCPRSRADLNTVEN